MKIVFAFGDSITYGSWGAESSGWADLLRKYLDSQKGYPAYYLYSLGVPGETSKGLADRFAAEVAARRRSDDDSYTFLIACGANDATWLNGEERFKQTKAEYSDNLKKVIELAKAVGGDIVLLNITPVNEKYSRQFKGKDKSCLNEYVAAYNTILEEVAMQAGVRVIDVNQAFKNATAETMLTNDGLHPNDQGHNLIFSTVKAELSL